MDKHLENFARKLAQDAVKRTGESLIEMFGEQNPCLKPALEKLQNGTRRYPTTKSANKGKKRQTEKFVCKRLAATIPKSRTEVVTDSGRIDILTPTEVIEVKQVRKYKHAMGQVISYGYYYPHHNKRIHLYGQVSSKQRKMIIKECFASQIEVTFEA